MQGGTVAFGASLLVCAFIGCSSENPSVPSDVIDAGTPFETGVKLVRFDLPISGVSAEELELFSKGDELFDLAQRDYDGLGPLYTRNNCGACHEGGVRGPGLVQKMSVVLGDQVTPADDQSRLKYGHTIHPLLTASAKIPILAPDDPAVRVTIRVGPPVLGRGYMEAILDSEIERVESEQQARTDAIHGRINHVIYASEANPDTRFHQHQKGEAVIGRFGLKARIATLDDFTADALQGDMGITSPLRPTEFANPDGLVDDLKPGIDMTIESLNARAMYMRLLAIPTRIPSATGEPLFAQAKCNVCHAATMKTRPDYPIAKLAGIDAHIYTDLLLHNMGDGLADGLGETDGQATSHDWRTAPLLGLRFNKTLLHDGRAHTIEEAILAHQSPNSEANESVDLFKAMSPSDHQLLIDFVNGL